MEGTDGEGRSRLQAASTTLGPIAVVVSRFPKFTETFVSNEILGLQRHGARVEIFPLLSRQRGPRQPAVDALVEQARFGAPWGVGALWNFGRVLIRHPKVLAEVAGQLVRDSWRHPVMLVKDLVLLPRICAISEEISALQVRHVHAHFLTHGGFAAWALGRLTGVPYSVVAHGSDVHRHRAMMRTKVLESEFIAAVSEFNRGVILDECGSELAKRVVVVRCGVDLDQISSTYAARRSGDPLILCVGTLHEVKGQRHLIEAAALLRADGRPVGVEFVGDGPDRAALQSLARELALEDWVHFAGPVPHDEVFARYRHADIVVAPSVPSSDGRREGIPTVLMEAMASGVPVVASNLTGIPELVEDGVTGLLAEPGSPASIARAVRQLLDSPDTAATIAAAGRERVIAEYSLTRTTALMLELMHAGTTPDTGTNATDELSG